MPDYFAGIQQILRIQRLFDRAHHRDRVTVLGIKEVELADAVLAVQVPPILRARITTR